MRNSELIQVEGMEKCREKPNIKLIELVKKKLSIKKNKK
jgi:hypothetical protein